MARALITMPKTATRGEIIEVRTLIAHPMETGYRVDDVGKPIPRNVIRDFVCRYNNAEAFRVDMSSGFAANPLPAWKGLAASASRFAGGPLYRQGTLRFHAYQLHSRFAESSRPFARLYGQPRPAVNAKLALWGSRMLDGMPI